MRKAVTTINTSINIAGITFKNPIMPASGTFGSGQEYSEFVDLHQLGAVVTKGVSLTPWEGNPAPRIMETETVVDMLEINISCPNVEHGGIAFGQEPKMVGTGHSGPWPCGTLCDLCGRQLPEKRTGPLYLQLDSL